MAQPFLTKYSQPDDNGWSFCRTSIGNFGESGDVQVEVNFGHDAASDMEGQFACWELAFFLSRGEFTTTHKALVAYLAGNREEYVYFGKHIVYYTRNEGVDCLAIEPALYSAHGHLVLRDPGPAMLSGCIIGVEIVANLFNTMHFLLSGVPLQQKMA